MTEDSHDREYLDLFKPKQEQPAKHPQEGTPPRAGAEPTETGETAKPIEAEPVSFAGGPSVGDTSPRRAGEPPLEGSVKAEFEPLSAASPGSGCTWRTVGLITGAGCLLLVLLAVVVFAFYQVFFRKEDNGEKATPAPTQVTEATSTPSGPPPTAVAESPIVVPLVNSGDVRVPVALPQQLTISDTVLTVRPVNVPRDTWPDAPTAGDEVNWIYGTVVNYILGLAPTPENQALMAALEAGDTLSLQMSTGLVLNFNVSEVTTGALDESAFFTQASPQLTLALLTDEQTQRTVATASFFNDEAGGEDLFSQAASGLVGDPVEQGSVRVTVIEVYQVAAGEAGLPAGTGYLLVDFSVENVGAQALETDYFQTFVSDATGERYPLTLLASQFAHYGLPSDPLAPGETVIGSAGYLVPRPPEEAQGQVRWVFNPLPGSDDWVVVPVAYELPDPTPTPEPAPVGFARVTLDADDVFVDRANNLLDVSLVIENVSDGVVTVTEAEVSLSSFADGEALLVSAAPPMPWTVEPGEEKIFQLQFDLPGGNDALLDVLGYTFSINNLGGE